jgi:hypothetical protein
MESANTSHDPARLRELANGIAGDNDLKDHAAALRDFARVVSVLERVNSGVELDVWIDVDGVSVAKLDFEAPHTGDTPLAAVLALAGKIEEHGA